MKKEETKNQSPQGKLRARDIFFPKSVDTNKICKCGHDEDNHTKHGFCMGHSIKGLYIPCTCKKFEPQEDLIPKEMHEELDKLKTFNKALKDHSQQDIRDKTKVAPYSVPLSQNGASVGTFNLGECIFSLDEDSNVLFVSDIKEFIKRFEDSINRQKGDLDKKKLIERLHKLAGSSLIGKKLK